MLRVGLTGGLGSGKSTVAAMLAALGAHVFSADEIGRQLMQPGQAVFAAIVQQFGTHVVSPDGTLDRPELARLAFVEGRVEELNAIVHPATIARQESYAREIFAADPRAIVIVESALIFETLHGADWSARFDRLILVTASDALKIARFVARSGGGNIKQLDIKALGIKKLKDEAHRRLARMIPDRQKAPQCDFVIHNDGSLQTLQQAAANLWKQLEAIAIP